MKGKKLYKSTAIKSIKALLLSIMIVLGANILIQVLQSDKIERFSGLYDYFLFYPEDLLIYLLLILIPGLYYSFIRGVVFYENGLTVNKGFPFFNMFIPYSNIQSYEMLQDKHLISINLKQQEDDLMLSIKDIDRAVAIFDQNHIKGDLGNNVVIDYSNRRKLILFFLVTGIFVFSWHYFSFTDLIIR